MKPQLVATALLLCVAMGAAVEFNVLPNSSATGTPCVDWKGTTTSLLQCQDLCAANVACIAAVFFDGGLCMPLSNVSSVMQGTVPNATLSLVRGALVWSATPVPLASSLPVAANGVLYFTNAAVNMFNGELIWNASVLANDNEYPLLVEELLILCGTSYTTLENGCYGLELSNGSVVWQTVIASASPILYAFDGIGIVVQTVYNTSDANHVQLLSLSPTSGLVQWNRTIDLGWFLGSSSNILFVNSFSGPTATAGILALNASTGSTLWHVSLEGNWTITDGRPDVFFTPDLLVVNFKNSEEYVALEMGTGKVVWASLLGNGGSCPGWPGMVPAVGGTVLCVGQSSAALLNATTGSTIWQFGASQMCSGGAVVPFGTNIIFTNGGAPPNCTVIFSVDALSGQLLWEGLEQECPLELFGAAGELFAVQVDGIASWNASLLTPERRYATALMAADQVQAASVLNGIMLLALLDGASTLQALWI